MTAPVHASRFPGLRAKAAALDREDSLRHLRDEFHIPTTADVKRKTLPAGGEITASSRTSRMELNFRRLEQ